MKVKLTFFAILNNLSNKQKSVIIISDVVI